MTSKKKCNHSKHGVISDGGGEITFVDMVKGEFVTEQIPPRSKDKCSGCLEELPDTWLLGKPVGGA